MILDKSLEWSLSWLAPPNPIDDEGSPPPPYVLEFPSNSHYDDVEMGCPPPVQTTPYGGENRSRASFCAEVAPPSTSPRAQHNGGSDSNAGKQRTKRFYNDTDVI